MAPLAELRNAIGKMRKNDVPVGEDGRARTGIRPFASSTSRNQPSTSQFLYGNSKWMRYLHPARTRLRAAVFRLLAPRRSALPPRCPATRQMQADYLNGDFYVNFGVALGLLPPGCTKAIAEEQYPGVRDA